MSKQLTFWPASDAEPKRRRPSYEAVRKVLSAFQQPGGWDGLQSITVCAWDRKVKHKALYFADVEAALAEFNMGTEACQKQSDHDNDGSSSSGTNTVANIAASS